MGEDLFHGMSTAELRKEVMEHVTKDPRALPEKAKVFAAIAKLQKYDQLAEVYEIAAFESLINAPGYIELNRGLAPTKGVSARVYFRELLRGAMYPGTQIAYGHGIYLATPSLSHDRPGFPLISHVAQKHARCPPGQSGIVVRCAMLPNARTLELDDLLLLFRENRNRAAAAGITDAGSFAATLGFDAFFRDGAYDDTDERVWNVVNRTALVFQLQGLQIAQLI